MAESADTPTLPSLTFLWDQFAPYHNDRCEAVAEHFADRYRVIGIEFASRSDAYAWMPSAEGRSFARVTLMPGQASSEADILRRLALLIGQLRREPKGSVFLCHFERPEILLTALWLRLRGRQVFIMQDSKFDDRPRRLWREIGKALLYLPYHGALASGTRTRDYLRLLGMSERRISLGYDTVSLARIRRLAGAPPAPGGAPFAARQFLVIARFVEKKNLFLALAAYDAYRRESVAPRALVLIGSGPLESELRAEVARRNLAGVRFTGFLQEKGVAEFLAQGLALILPSTEEQWGLVVNEALAMGVPALVSENVGARDELVRSGINGYVFEPDNALGLAQLMTRLAGDEAEWRRLSAGANELAPRGDVARFASAVARIIGEMS